MEPSRSLDCLCVGLLVADHACDPIEQIPRSGQLVRTSRLALSVGGCAANVAVDLVRLGASAAVIGCVGDDDLGRFMRRSLARAGADCRGIRTLADCDTSASLIVNVHGEDRRFIHAAGANLELAPSDIPLELVCAARVLYVGGYLLMPKLAGEPLANLFRQARAASVTTVLDCILPGEGDHWSALAPVLAETDYFLPNQDEAAAITGLSEPIEQAERFVAAGARVAVITCGAAGSVLVSNSERLQAGVYPVTCQSATGAGDAFDAGFILGLMQGCDLSDCLRWASAVGASAARSTSATESVFTRAEADRMMHEHDLSIERI